jgi:RNA polymerase sigma factor (sigma-70 family)
VLGPVRTLFGLGTIGELTDGQLLERFATDSGEGAELAFAVLVERHAPMVLRVCRGVLADPHDSEDAFQATFFVLVQKARGLWVHDTLGPWLHQVALRTAACARSSAARRRRLEQAAAVPVETTQPTARDELARTLHEEIARLPEAFRRPLVLCDLEGNTYEQAARSLGWRIGTVKSRLSRGRERLRGRLVRRGFGPGSGLFGAGLGPVFVELPIPAELIATTASAAVTFGYAPTLVRGPAAVLALGVLRAMITARWLKIASMLLALGATVGGIPLVTLGRALGDAPQDAAKATATDKMATYEIRLTPLPVTVAERGTVEATRVSEVYNRIPGETTIMKLLPEGSAVKRGDLVCELDASVLRDALINQTINVKVAAANYQNARLARDNAEADVAAYIEGTHKQELHALHAEITLAESAIKKAKAQQARAVRAKASSKAGDRGGKDVTSTEAAADLEIDLRIDEAEHDVVRETLALEAAKMKRETLEKFTYPRTIRQLKSAVEDKRLAELGKEQIWKLEQSKEAKIRESLTFTRLTAPSDGVVAYFNDAASATNRSPGGRLIEEGMTVRERQRIFQIVDRADSLQVAAKLPEEVIDLVKPGLKARVVIDAFPNLTLQGTVTEVATLPVPPQLARRANVREYRTTVHLPASRLGLRPGMTAHVEILAERPDAITVPRTAVDLNYPATVAVEKPDGRFERRSVKTGQVDDQTVEIKAGLRVGEKILLDPSSISGASKAARPGASASTPAVK